ncbi:MAG: cytochrome c assembly protein [Phycisphaerales bacterium]|nr:cytochrome c assembly protein [Phycisphaerales bacterium]
MLKTILKPFASLTLTVILLAFSMVLIYAGTLAQVDTDIWKVQHQYFHSFIAWMPLQDLVPRFTAVPAHEWGRIPFPGGYIIGSLLLINLLSAHAVRFKFSPKDLFLIPQILIIGAALYFWQIHYDRYTMAVALIVGTLFLVTLFLVHEKRAGVIIIHLGLILLLAGEGITSGAAKESRMRIEEGSYTTYSEDIRTPELAIVDKSDPKQDHHMVVAPSALKPGATIDDARLPFQIKVDRFFTNSRAVAASDPAVPSLRDDSGPAWTAEEIKNVSGVQGGAVDLPSAFVTLNKDGKLIGSYVVTVMTTTPHIIDVGGKTYELSLRFLRDYKPYTIALRKFSFDRYTGTNVPRNYSSDITLTDPANSEHRDVRIWMNHPMRYRGETFYQQSFDERTEKATVLQVVRNPAMTIPYTAIVIAGIGLIVHFGVSLINFLAKRTLTGQQLSIGLVLVLVMKVVAFSFYMTLGIWGVLIVGVVACLAVGAFLSVRWDHQIKLTEAEAKQRLPVSRKKKGDESKYELAPESLFTANFLVPAGLLGFCLFYVLAHISLRPLSPTYDMDAFAKIPLSYEGRVQPMDSLARNALKVMRGRESALLVTKDKDGKDEEKTIQPVPWLLDVLTGSEASGNYKTFVIDHPDVKTYLGLDEKKKYFSANDLMPAEQKLKEAFAELGKIRLNKSKTLSEYQNALLEVCDRIALHATIRAYPQLHVVPPTGTGDWTTVLEAAQASQATGQRDPVAEAFLRTLGAYDQKQPETFNAELRKYQRLIDQKVSHAANKAAFESWYNRFGPINLSLALYIGVFILAAFSWVGFSRPLARAAFWVLGLALVIHTFGLAARIYMSGRPPVTNLASSAIFIGWGMIVFATCLELIYKNGIGSVLAAVAGIPTLIIAQRLSLDGDTMKVLQAVLDTNIWLATHVVCITLGYAATFLAGLIGIAYITTGLFTPFVDNDLKKTFGRMMYGITCFALLFSFVGTILGGIWADQSWGRFWGWDPKENGAILIVLANAIFLHARWGGLVKERGMANIAIFGNIVTAWSYFGTNMLGVGLHSYGFMASAVMWLMLFIGSQIFFIGCGLLPLETWRSFKNVDLEAEILDASDAVDQPARPRPKAARNA